MVVIGIDLGSTYSCVAIWREGNVEVITNEQGNRTTPSYVAYTSSERLIGESAKNQASVNPLNTVFGAKRIIGRRYDDIGVQMDLRHWPYKVIDHCGKPKIMVKYKGADRLISAEEISGTILYRMKQIAESQLGCEVKDAVVTVPAYFNDSQRRATKIAGKIAGLNILRIVNEPTAAALAYGLDRNLKKEKSVLVYDLGGGTFDVSVLTISGGVYEVKSTAGNTRLGGDDFDNRIIAYIVEDFRNKFKKDVLPNARALTRMKIAAENVKRSLTSCTEAVIDIECLCDGIHYRKSLTRALFEELCSDLFRDTLRFVTCALKDARITKNEIDDVILIGGSTRIPKVKSLLQDYFENKQLRTSINPEEAVARGAAIHGAVLFGDYHERIQDLLLVDVVPLSLGIEAGRGLMFKVIERNTPIPCQKTKDVSTLEDYQKAMTIEVFEGERSLTKDNNLLGYFHLDGLPPAPRGVVTVDVTFDVDANGVLNVEAKDRSTGNLEKITIQNVSRTKQEEINKMIDDAEKFKEEDKENKQRLEARNQLESYVFGVKRTINEEGYKLNEKERGVMKVQCEEAIIWLNTNVDCLREEYERKMTELMRRWSRMMNVIYGYNWRNRVKRQKSDGNDQSNTTVEEILDGETT